MTEDQKSLLSDISPDMIFDVMGANPGMTLKEMMDADSKARSSEMMRYFPKRLVGRIPNYATFLGLLSRGGSNSEALDRFLSEVREIELSQSLVNMEGIARTYDGESPAEGRKFGMYSQLSKVYSKQLERLDKKMAKHTEERKVDLLEKLVDKLTDAQLIQIRDNVKGALEYNESRETEVVDNAG